ncbi:serine/threonine-protein kinase [Streptomyces sp. NPDC088258]|uniref:serine/threonine-protein kinase n=1 Tax=Streptomyces sp. NPDC088258 TaxID=3365849 RepID=UPI00382331E0
MGEIFAGRYELIDPIGRGGVGAVWRAWDQRRRRYVAAKVLQQSDAHTLLRFVREQALRIDHPHVLAPASWAADDDKVLFTMDLVSGGSLAHVIGDYGPLPPRFVCTLLDQLLAGLAAVHAEGVVHRDIKPANILMEATGTARPHLRLSDFGISMRKGEPRLTETNYVVGTPGYFAPEQMMGAEPDFPSDLFAVGLVALYLLQGQKPDSKALVEHFAAHGTPGAPQGIPEPLWQVLAGLLQPDPHARFRTATGARKALATAVELLPEQTADDEPVEVFDQIGPLPPGFGPSGPLKAVAPPDAPPAAPTPSASHAPAPPTPSEASSASSAFAAPVPSVPSVPSAAPATPPAMSETGSFHLPPPPSREQPDHSGLSARPMSAEVPVAQAQTEAVRPEPGPTRAYTAQHAHPSAPPQPQHAQHPHQQPQPPQQPQRSQPPRTTTHHAARKQPGPPRKVAIPILVLALACFAVGIWALTQS